MFWKVRYNKSNLLDDEDESTNDFNARFLIRMEFPKEKPYHSVVVRGIDIVNYSILGDERGDELFHSTCDKEFRWQNIIVDDNFVLDEQMRTNLKNLTVPQFNLNTGRAKLFKQQTHQMYHLFFDDLLSANRETRKQYVEAFLSEKNNEQDKNSSSK